MEELKAKATHLKDHVQEYVMLYKELAKAKATKAAASAASGVFIGVTAFIFVFFLLFFVSFALGIWFGDLVNNRVAGFFMVAGLYLLLILILFALRKKVIVPMIRNTIISKIYE